MNRGLLLAAGAFLCWGLLSPGNAILLEHMGPLWMQGSRALFALLIVAPWLGRRMAASGRLLARPRILLALVLGTVASFTLFSVAQTRIGPAEATLGFFLAPLWSALFGWWLLREGVGWRFVPVVAAVLGGGALALGVEGSSDVLGYALAIGSGLTWGIYSVLLRRDASDVPWPHLLGASMLLATPTFLLAAAAFEPMPDWTALAPEAWRWSAIQVAIPTILAIALFQSALQRAPAARVNLFVGLELVGAVAWSALLIGARYSAIQLTGVGIVLVAVTAYLLMRGSEPEQPPSAPA